MIVAEGIGIRQLKSECRMSSWSEALEMWKSPVAISKGLVGIVESLGVGFLPPWHFHGSPFSSPRRLWLLPFAVPPFAHRFDLHLHAVSVMHSPAEDVIG
jgi:hypothetical protein